MIGFLLKKSFWDYWDRMGLMVLLNLGFTAIVIGSYYLIGYTQDNNLLFMGSVYLFNLMTCLYLGMITGAIEELIHNKSFYWNLFATSLKKSFLKSFVFSIILFVAQIVFRVVFQFYGQADASIFSLVPFFIMCWFLLMLLMAQIWFFPLLQRMNDPLFKHLKKCVLLSLDNGGVSFFSFLWGALLVILSFATLFLIPGITAVMILWHNSLKLVMLKYDYLEENPETDRKKIPWNIILQDEKETLGKRGWRNLIRPWKM